MGTVPGAGDSLVFRYSRWMRSLSWSLLVLGVVFALIGGLILTSGIWAGSVVATAMAGLLCIGDPSRDSGRWSGR